MNMMKRGLIALSMVAAVGGATGGLLVSQASATSTHGREVIQSTQYTVGAGDGVGPWSGFGVVHTQGNVTDIPSLPADPANSNRHTLVDPTGSFTVLTTGGTGPANGPSLNPVTCFVHFTIRDIDANIVSGTGAFANATGHFKATVRISGFLSRTATGACDTNQNDPLAFSTTNVVAVGHINLHPAPAQTS
jgi:hypothetical protein